MIADHIDNQIKFFAALRVVLFLVVENVVGTERAHHAHGRGAFLGADLEPFQVARGVNRRLAGVKTAAPGIEETETPKFNVAAALQEIAADFAVEHGRGMFSVLEEIRQAEDFVGGNKTFGDVSRDFRHGKADLFAIQNRPKSPDTFRRPQRFASCRATNMCPL